MAFHILFISLFCRFLTLFEKNLFFQIVLKIYLEIDLLNDHICFAEIAFILPYS